MKPFLRYSLLGLLAFLAFLLLLAPATLVTDRVAEHLPGFSVQNVSGSVTDGIAQGLHWRGNRIEQLSWDWQPLALLSGWLEAGLRSNDPDMQAVGKVAIAFDRSLRLRDANGRMSLSRLAALAGHKSPAQGILEFSLRDLYLDANARPQSAYGAVHVLNLRVDLRQPLNLGDFTLQLTPVEPAGIQGVIEDHDGPLALQGTVKLFPDGRYQVDGQAAVRDPANQALRQALSLLGPPDANGRWPLNFSGVLAR